MLKSKLTFARARVSSCEPCKIDGAILPIDAMSKPTGSSNHGVKVKVLRKVLVKDLNAPPLDIKAALYGLLRMVVYY